MMAPEERLQHVASVCRAAGVRMPNVKARYIVGCFKRVRNMGGPAVARDMLLSCAGRKAKLDFLDGFPGIGPKYARNIMMDVYHPEFRESIAIDARINAISALLQLSLSSYEDKEAFYLDVAKEAGVSGWELDRLMFNFNDEIKKRLGEN